MKTIFAILILMTATANASQVECTEAIRAFNKKYSSKAEFVFLDHGNNGTPLFLRTKPGAAKPDDQQAAGMSLTRICIKAGFPNSVYMGDMDNDTPKSFCQIQNLNTMGAICDQVRSAGKGPNPQVIKLK